MWLFIMWSPRVVSPLAQQYSCQFLALTVFSALASPFVFVQFVAHICLSSTCSISFSVGERLASQDGHIIFQGLARLSFSCHQ